MKIKLNLANRGCQLELDVESPKDAVRQLSVYTEILAIGTCGQCGSNEIKFSHRVVDNNDFYGMRCISCQAQLDFGQHKTGDTLFVKREKGSKGSDGWYHYEKNGP